MHDGLPSGDLEQLLGEIPHYSPTPCHGAGRLPDLGEDGAHPYHILVVYVMNLLLILVFASDDNNHINFDHSAGQECPSVSGLPMAIGAGYRIYEKDKKSHGKKTDTKHHSSASLHLQTDSSPTRSSFPDASSSGLKPSNSTGDITSMNHTTPHPGGWSYLLDDWLVHGNKAPRRKHNSGDPVPNPPSSEAHDKLQYGPANPSKPELDLHTEDPHANSAVTSSLDRKRQMSPSLTEPFGDLPVSDAAGSSPAPHQGTNLVGGGPTDSGSPALTHVGPYELAAKERMMGIYLAVYVHREAKPLIRGECSVSE